MSVRRPPVTIGLPVYNGELFLADALASILGQTFEDFVLVVSDNASTDATVDIVEEHAARDERIVVLRGDMNRGAAWNYNRVFAECRTPYFKWAAADDMLAPTYIERLLSALDTSPASVVLAYPHTQLVDADGVVVGEFVDELASQPGAPPYVRVHRVASKIALGNVIFALMRADALARTRLHGNYPAADYVLLAELALLGEFRVVPEPLFRRRLHEGISSRANPTRASLTHWFDTQRAPVQNPSVNLLREYLAGIQHASLPRSQRQLASLLVTASWVRRQTALRTRVRALARRLRRST
jgi:glycosyltransferase involved in cell wall biosynthesis